MYGIVYNNQNVDFNNGTQQGIGHQQAQSGKKTTKKTAVTVLCQEYEMIAHEYNNTYCPEGN